MILFHPFQKDDPNRRYSVGQLIPVIKFTVITSDGYELDSFDYFPSQRIKLKSFDTRILLCHDRQRLSQRLTGDMLYGFRCSDEEGRLFTNKIPSVIGGHYGENDDYLFTHEVYEQERFQQAERYYDLFSVLSSLLTSIERMKLRQNYLVNTKMSTDKRRVQMIEHRTKLLHQIINHCSDQYGFDFKFSENEAEDYKDRKWFVRAKVDGTYSTNVKMKEGCIA